jgi:hypothetical protein
VQSLTSGCAEALARQKVYEPILGPLPVRIRDALNGAQFDELAAVHSITSSARKRGMPPGTIICNFSKHLRNSHLPTSALCQSCLPTPWTSRN